MAIDESEAVEGLLKQKKKISSKNLNETLLHRSKTSINNERERDHGAAKLLGESMRNMAKVFFFVQIFNARP